MQITQSDIKGFKVLTIEGEVDLNSSPEMRKVFNDLIDKGAKKIVVSFERVAYIDSSGLATLIEMMQRLKKSQGSLYFFQMSEKIKNLFEITKLDKLFAIYRTQDEALTVV